MPERPRYHLGIRRIRSNTARPLSSQIADFNSVSMRPTLHADRRSEASVHSAAAVLG